MMKKERFKELMNAHLDGCLSAAEAEELHAALAACPERRREFMAYQRLQAGCAALFEQTARKAPCAPRLARALREAEARMAEPRREAWGWPSWGVAGGLAACGALITIRLAGPGAVVADAESNRPVADLGVAVAAAPAVPEVISVAAPTPRVRVVRMPDGLGFAALGMAAGTSGQASATSKWTLSEAEIPAYAQEEIAAMNRAVQLSRRGAASGPGFTPASTATFGRPASAAWSGASGWQVEAASYRFER